MQTGKEEGEIFKVFIEKEKKTHLPIMLYPEKTSFKSEENRDFLKQTKPEGICWLYTCLARNIKEVLQREGK